MLIFDEFLNLNLALIIEEQCLRGLIIFHMRPKMLPWLS